MDEQNQQADPTASLSDDDIAAALGFHTTLSEPLIPQDAGTDQQAEATQTADESPQRSADARDIGDARSPNVSQDDSQDAEIKDIRDELEALKQDIQNEQSGKTEENTGTSE